MKRPSRDQSVGLATIAGGTSLNNDSFPSPLDSATRISESATADRLNAIFVPSGDHTGYESSPGFDVTRELTARARSTTQTSRLGGEPVVIEIAARRSSGDSAMMY